MPSQPRLPTWQEHWWEEAGVTKAMMGEAIRQAHQKTLDQLEATNVKAFCTRDGKVVYSKALPDHAVQAQAAERTFKFMLPRVSSEGQRVQIVNPDWAYGEATPEEIEQEHVQALEAPKENAYTAEDAMSSWEKERQP